MLKKVLGSSKRYLLNLLNEPAVILLYHRVSLLKNDPQLLSVTPDNFYDHIELLKKEYNLLPIEEFTDSLIRRKKFASRSVIITFDDGYADNCSEALPVLETLHSQALFYITTSNINTPYELWWDELERIFLEEHHLPSSIELPIGNRTQYIATTDKTDRVKAYYMLHLLLKYIRPSERNNIIDSLQRQAGLSKEGRSTHRLMTTEELKKLNTSIAATIGAHTHNHPALSILGYQDQLEEIDLSKNTLENITQKKIEHFSYPYGSKKDYNRVTIDICRKTGFKMVCSNYYGQVHKWTDILQVPRVLVRNWNKDDFGQFMTKIFKY